MNSPNQQKAIQFLEGFSERNLEKLSSVLAEDFRFEGPLYSCSSAAEYLGMLKSDPPDKSTFAIQSIFENGNMVCIIYRFQKHAVDTQMAQVFTLEKEKISATTLIFDGRQMM